MAELVVNYLEDSQDGQVVRAFTKKEEGVQQFHLTLYDAVGPLVQLKKNPSHDFGGGNIFIMSQDVEKFGAFLEQQYKMSNAHRVRDFTSRGGKKTLPDKPRIMTRDEVKFILRMVLSELTELAQTVTSNVDEAVELVRSSIGADLKPAYKHPSKDDPDYTAKVVSNQADAFVDAWYYMLDAAAKSGINLSRIFHVVHKGNTDKRLPNGEYLIRPEDGKVLKPENWKEPDVVGEIKKQMTEGAW